MKNKEQTLTQQLIGDARDIMESFDISPAMTIGFDKDEYILTPKQMTTIAGALYLADCEIAVRKTMDNEKEIITVHSTDRHNPLSDKPTNNVVKVVYKDKVSVYDNIHYPQAFIMKIQQNKDNTDWTEIWLNDKLIKTYEKD